MSGPRPVVWVVASKGTTRRWLPALRGRRFAPWPLVWSEARAMDPEEVDVSCAMREARDDLAILTSANAARFLSDDLCAGVRAACVGESTAQAARAKGFDVVHVGTAGGEALARELLAAMPDLARVNYLHQRHARTEGWKTLAEAGVVVGMTCTYRMEDRADFGGQVAVAPGPAAVALGSPLAADALARALTDAGRTLAPGVCFAALGATTAAHASELFGGRVRAARASSPEGLAEAVARALEPTEETGTPDE